MQNDDTLSTDLERVGRWFWLTVALGGAFRIAEFPVLLPILGVVLLSSLHRLSRGWGGDVVRPDMALPAVAVVIVEAAIFATFLPFLSDTVVIGIWVVASLALVGGIGSYISALADFVRRAGLGDGRSNDDRARRWWVTSAAQLVLVAVLLAVTGADGLNSPAVVALGITVVWMVVAFVGLYNLGHAQWEVQLLAKRARQPQSDLSRVRSP